jgi:hypothetical protein
MLWVRYMHVQECPLICPSFSWLYDEQIRSLWRISHQVKHDKERLPLIEVNQWYHDVCRHFGLLGRVLHILWRCKQTKLDHFDCFISIWSMGYKSKKYQKNRLIDFTCCYYQVNHLVCSTLPQACLCTREPYRNCGCRWSIIWYICLPRMR